jgi:hypothetical protein
MSGRLPAEKRELRGAVVAACARRTGTPQGQRVTGPGGAKRGAASWTLREPNVALSAMTWTDWIVSPLIVNTSRPASLRTRKPGTAGWSPAGWVTSVAPVPQECSKCLAYAFIKTLGRRCCCIVVPFRPFAAGEASGGRQFARFPGCGMRDGCLWGGPKHLPCAACVDLGLARPEKVTADSRQHLAGRLPTVGAEQARTVRSRPWQTFGRCWLPG